MKRSRRVLGEPAAPRAGTRERAERNHKHISFGWAVSLGLLAASGLGCTTGAVPRIGESPPTAKDPADEQKYLEVFQRYSDQHAIYQGVDTRAFVAATVQSKALVEARVRRDGEFRGLPKHEVEQNLLAEQARLEAVREVVLGVHVNEPKYDDFDKADSIWRLTLKSGDEELRPTSVRRLGRSRANLSAIYPYLDTFWVAYVAQFPQVKRFGPLKLRVASVLGQAELQFPAE